MHEMTYLPVARLYPHPDNPRRELGDLTELADSIKANGILQNLTVVPMPTDLAVERSEEAYTVIIGHRRLAAAMQAGLSEVPCVIAQMTPKEQVQTMLLENIQRSDLTVYEQAQGFQLMLDMGETVETIAKESGFSQSTVRRRVKLLELDPDKFKASEARGATIQDYMELDKIQDPELKNKVLESIGTANFAAEVKRAIETERTKAFLSRVESILSGFATPIKTPNKVGDEDVPMEYVTGYYAYSGWKEGVIPEDADRVKYFYTSGAYSFTLYKERGKAEQYVESEEDRLRRERREAAEQRCAALEAITARHFELRKDFVKGFSAVKKHSATILRMAADAIITADQYSSEADIDILEELLRIKMPDDTDLDDNREMIADCVKERPEYTLLALAYSVSDAANNQYWGRRWDANIQTCRYEYRANDDLDRLYDQLSELGYKMSDEELAMMNGTHELLQDDEQEKVGE